jgi:subtilisin family serine protease
MAATDALRLTSLSQLMNQTAGDSGISVAIIDGPVAANHPAFANGTGTIRELSANGGGACMQPNSTACLHGTFIAGILAARRSSPVPGICPECRFIVRPIFAESRPGDRSPMPYARPEELGGAIRECVNAGAHVINLSLALAQPSVQAERDLMDALDYAFARGRIVVAAAGNQGAVGTTAITRHPYVIPVVAYDRQGKLLPFTNLAASIGQRGVGAIGDEVTSLATNGRTTTSSGTSVATPFVTGAIALLWSVFPRVAANVIRHAIRLSASPRRTSIVPPLLNAWAAHEMLAKLKT